MTNKEFLSKMKATILGLVLFLAAGLGIVACGDDDDDVDNGNINSDETRSLSTQTIWVDGESIRCIIVNESRSVTGKRGYGFYGITCDWPDE